MILEDVSYLVTQNPEREVLEDVDIRVRNGRVARIGKNLVTRDEESLDFSGKLVMPGLINTHTHAAMTLFRGISDDRALQDWLEEDIFPAEQKLEEGDAYIGAKLAAVEMLETGTTAFNDMYFHMDTVAKAAEEAGMRAVLSHGLVDLHGSGYEDVAEASRLLERYSDHELVIPGVAPHSVYTCSEELLIDAKDMADRNDALYHIHVSETRKENREHREAHGSTPVEYLDDLGLLDENTVIAHGTHLDGKDIETLRRTGTSVAHNPAANLKLGSGVAPLIELREAGVNVSLGTDGVASNNSLNLFEEAKIAALLQKERDPEKLSAQEILDMLTLNAAEALGLEAGAVEEGKKADLVAVDMDHPGMTPFHGKPGLVSNLVFSFNGEVSDVFVNGERVVEDGEAVNVDRERVMEKARSTARKF